LYIAVMAERENRMTTKFEVVELVFDVYGAGWVRRISSECTVAADKVTGT
jgi:hypothetical protein